MRFLLALLLAVPLVARAAAPVATNIANFPSVSVHYTNYISEGIVSNGFTLGGVRKTAWPADTIFTNAGNRVYLQDTNKVIMLGQSEFNSFLVLNGGTNLVRMAGTFTDSNFIDANSYIYSPIYFATEVSNTNGTPFGALHVDMVPPSGGVYTNLNWATGIFVENDVTIKGTRGLYGYNVASSFATYAYPSGDAYTSQVHGFHAEMYATSAGSQYAGSFFSDSTSGTKTNLAIAASVRVDSNTNYNAAAYFEATTSVSDDPVIEQSVMLLDNRGSGYPLLIARTNNGTRVASISADGSFTSEGTIQAKKAFQPYQGTLTHAGSVALDFNGTTTVNSITLTGALTVTFSNLNTNRTYRLKIQNAQATNCTLTLPSGVHGYYTTTLSNGWHMASFESWGSVASNVWVSTSSDGTY